MSDDSPLRASHGTADSEPNLLATPADVRALVRESLAAITPARLAVGRSGPAYRTATQLALREAHAAAVDAVRAECDPTRDWGEEFVRRWRIVAGRTEAMSKDEYLLRPDLGRRLSADTRATITAECPPRADLQVAVGDGLSASAAVVQTPRLLPRLTELASESGLVVGRPVFVRFARVGILNDLGDLLDPAVVVLLIGERPGMATAESLSAYCAYRPRSGDNDSRRNLISNIHARGVGVEEAARRILALVKKMLALRTSGVAVKEDGLMSRDAAAIEGKE
jgi:ethanolamine ammonia-lyase small subunit